MARHLKIKIKNKFSKKHKNKVRFRDTIINIPSNSIISRKNSLVNINFSQRASLTKQTLETKTGDPSSFYENFDKEILKVLKFNSNDSSVDGKEVSVSANNVIKVKVYDLRT